MLNNKEKKSMRNPFPAIGKVFKYEFISTARIFVPIYAAMIIVAFLAGLLLFINLNGSSTVNQAIQFFEHQGFSNAGAFVEGILLLALYILCLASVIITFILLL